MHRFIIFTLALMLGTSPVALKKSAIAQTLELMDQSPALHDVRGLIEGVPVRFAPLKIRGTCSAKHYLKYYSAVKDHIQGITMIGNYFILAQSTGNLPHGEKKRTLLVVGDGRKKCSFHLVGRRFPHCGGIQACGNILVVPVEPRYDGEKHHGKGSEVLFIDFSNPQKPIELPLKIERPEKYASAVGIAYHSFHRCHYVVVFASDLDFYKSNGLPLRHPKCRFELVASMESRGATSGGGVNLLYEDTGALYMAGLKRTGDGWEQIILSRIKNLEREPTIVPLKVKYLSKSKSGKNLAAGFRWGGGIIIKNSRDIDVLAAPRTLCYGPGNNFTKIKGWTKSPWVRLVHEGGYVAKFYLSWTVDGKKKTWKSGKKAYGYKKTLVLPENARNVHLNAQAMTGLLGKKAWKDIIREEISPQHTFEVYGTTLRPRCQIR